MDRVTKSYLDEFRTEQSLSESMSDSDVFEYFADYCIVSSVHEEEFDTADVHVGGTGDLGLDGLAVIVNGVLVSSIDEAEDLLGINGFLDVKFVLVQAKTSKQLQRRADRRLLRRCRRVLYRDAHAPRWGTDHERP